MLPDDGYGSDPFSWFVLYACRPSKLISGLLVSCDIMIMSIDGGLEVGCHC